MAFIFTRIRRMIVITILSACMIICFSGCDVHYGERPDDYPNTKWICKDPDIVFTVSESEELYCEISGAPLKKGLVLAFGFGAEFWIYDEVSGEDLFVGHSKYSPQIMYVDVTEDHIFGGTYEGKRIAFERVNE